MNFLEHPDLPLEWQEKFKDTNKFELHEIRNVIIIRILSENPKYNPYIHISMDEDGWNLQMFDLNLSTGEKTPLSAKLYDELVYLLEKASFNF